MAAEKKKRGLEMVRRRGERNSKTAIGGSVRRRTAKKERRIHRERAE